MSEKIKVKYFSDELDQLQFTGDWVDLRVSAVTARMETSKPIERLSKNDFKLIKKGQELKVFFGVAMELPKCHEAIILPRGSLFKNTGLIFTASGVVDEGYNGDGDEWFGTFKATKDTRITGNERVCQFRIQEKQPELIFETVEVLGNENRGGHGSTGRF